MEYINFFVNLFAVPFFFYLLLSADLHFIAKCELFDFVFCQVYREWESERASERDGERNHLRTMNSRVRQNEHLLQ